MQQATPSLLYAGVFQPHLLAHALGRDPARPALHLADGRLLSVGEVRDFTSQYLQALSGSGLRPGARVGILSKSRPEVIHAMNALMPGGYCMVPLPPVASQDDLACMAGDAALEALIFDPMHFQDAARQLQAQWPRLELLLAMGPTQIGTALAAFALRFTPRATMPPDVGADDICRIGQFGPVLFQFYGQTEAPMSISGGCTHRASGGGCRHRGRHRGCEGGARQ